MKPFKKLSTQKASAHDNCVFNISCHRQFVREVLGQKRFIVLFPEGNTKKSQRNPRVQHFTIFLISRRKVTFYEDIKPLKILIKMF